MQDSQKHEIISRSRRGRALPLVATDDDCFSQIGLPYTESWRQMKYRFIHPAGRLDGRNVTEPKQDRYWRRPGDGADDGETRDSPRTKAAR